MIIKQLKNQVQCTDKIRNILLQSVADKTFHTNPIQHTAATKFLVSQVYCKQEKNTGIKQ